MNREFNETSFIIWKIMEFQAKNNIKTPLGLISLMVNLNHNHDHVLEEGNTKDVEMEF